MANNANARSLETGPEQQPQKPQAALTGAEIVQLKKDAAEIHNILQRMPPKAMKVAELELEKLQETLRTSLNDLRGWANGVLGKAREAFKRPPPPDIQKQQIEFIDSYIANDKNEAKLSADDRTKLRSRIEELVTNEKNPQVIAERIKAILAEHGARMKQMEEIARKMQIDLGLKLPEDKDRKQAMASLEYQKTVLERQKRDKLESLLVIMGEKLPPEEERVFNKLKKQMEAVLAQEFEKLVKMGWAEIDPNGQRRLTSAGLLGAQPIKEYLKRFPEKRRNRIEILKKEASDIDKLLAENTKKLKALKAVPPPPPAAAFKKKPEKVASVPPPIPEKALKKKPEVPSEVSAPRKEIEKFDKEILNLQQKIETTQKETEQIKLLASKGHLSKEEVIRIAEMKNKYKHFDNPQQIGMHVPNRESKIQEILEAKKSLQNPEAAKQIEIYERIYALEEKVRHYEKDISNLKYRKDVAEDNLRILAKRAAPEEVTQIYKRVPVAPPPSEGFKKAPTPLRVVPPPPPQEALKRKPAIVPQKTEPIMAEEEETSAVRKRSGPLSDNQSIVTKSALEKLQDSSRSGLLPVAQVFEDAKDNATAAKLKNAQIELTKLMQRAEKNNDLIHMQGLKNILGSIKETLSKQDPALYQTIEQKVKRFVAVQNMKQKTIIYKEIKETETMDMGEVLDKLQRAKGSGIPAVSEFLENTGNNDLAEVLMIDDLRVIKFMKEAEEKEDMIDIEHPIDSTISTPFNKLLTSIKETLSVYPPLAQVVEKKIRSLVAEHNKKVEAKITSEQEPPMAAAA